MITVILIIAIIVLGPEKLPKVLVELAKYFKVIKKTINDAKSSFDQELRIAELKEDAKKYKESITQASEGVRKKLTFEELDEIKGGIDSVKETLNAGLKDAESSLKETLSSDAAKDVLNSAKVSAQKQNETAIFSYNQTDFVKNRVAIEVQFGKYSFVAYDVFVKHLAFYVGDKIDVGIEILPMKALQAEMSSGVSYYEGELYNVVRQGRGVPAVPLIIIGIGQ